MKGNRVAGWKASSLILLVLSVTPLHGSFGMEAKVVDDQLILSGPVIHGDFSKIQNDLAGAPGVRTVILRDSNGGDIATGYQTGELFRQKGLRTAVSGFCYSSCSRMFLGGATRLFTDDMPAERTHVGFHGHYDKGGRLVPQEVQRLRLKDWIIRYSDGRADPALVERWISIPFNGGMIHFFHPGLRQHGGVSTFMCEGPPPPGQTVFDCEPIAKTALDLGILTGTDVISSNDLVDARASVPTSLVPSGYAAIDDLEKVKLIAPKALKEYQRFVNATLPRAFAIAPDRNYWAWRAGSPDAAAMALVRCAERAGKTCHLYAVNGEVIWNGN